MHADNLYDMQKQGALDANQADSSRSNGNESRSDNSSAKFVEASKGSQQNPAGLIEDTTPRQTDTATIMSQASDEVEKPPPSSGVLWDDSDAEVQEPLSESSIKLDRESWQDKQRTRSLERAEQPSRQEDTELGIFRPDEL